MSAHNEERLEEMLTEFCKHFQYIGSKVILDYNKEAMGEKMKISSIASIAGSVLKRVSQCVGIGVGVSVTGFPGLVVGLKVAEEAGEKLNDFMMVPFASSHKEKAKKISERIGYYINSHERCKLNKILIDVAVEIFFHFESQFGLILHMSHQKYTMHKLASDAVARAMNYINRCDRPADDGIPVLIVKGILYGNSKESAMCKLTPRLLEGFPVGNKLMPHPGRTIQTSEGKCISGEFWSKPGVTDGRKFCHSIHCDVEKFGYRRLFSFEKFSAFPFEIHGNVHNSYEYQTCNKKIEAYQRMLTESCFQGASFEQLHCSDDSLNNRYSGKFWPCKMKLINAFVIRSHIPDKSIVDFINERINITGELVVSGLAGTGKSTIARWFSDEYENNYDYIFWFDCSNENALHACITQLAASIGMRDIEKNPQTIIAHEIYKCYEGMKCLFNFDGAEDYLGLRSILPDTENFRTIHSLVTSRHDILGGKSDFGEMECYKISDFSDTEAIEFLNGEYGLGSSPELEVQELSKTLHNHPLALRQAAAYINRTKNLDPKFGISKLLWEFKVNPQIFLSSQNLDDYNHSIYATFMEEYELIEQEPSSGKLAATILSITSYFHSLAIDFEMLYPINGYSVSEILNSLQLLRERSIIVCSSRMARFDLLDLFQLIIRIRNKGSEENYLKMALTCLEGSQNNMTHLKKAWDYAQCYPRLLQEFKPLYDRSVQMPLNVGEFSNVTMNNIISLSLQDDTQKFLESSQDKCCQGATNE